MSYRLLFYFLVRFILFSKITFVSFCLVLKLKNSFSAINVRRCLGKSTGQAPLLAFWSLHFIRFHFFNSWSVLLFLELIGHFFTKFSKTCTCEAIVVFLLVHRAFQESFELIIKIIIFVNYRKLRRSMINRVSAELIIENIEIIEVILPILIGLLLNRSVINDFLNVGLNFFTFLFDFPLSASAPVFVFLFGILLLSHKFWKF